MSGSLFGLLELLLVFGLVFWFGFSQLRAVRRPDASGRESGHDEDSERRD